MPLRIVGWLDGLCFPPVPASRLAVLRLIIGGYALWFVGTRYDSYLRIAGSSPSLFAPVGVTEWLTQPVPIDTFRIVLMATLVLNVLFLVGVKFRYTGPLFAAGLLSVLCYRNSWTMIYHSSNLLVFHAIILGLAPSANALSFDAWVQSRWRSRWWSHGAWLPAERSGHRGYGWPIRAICAVTVATYLLCGVAKVSGEVGWSWAYGDALATYIARDGIRKELLADGASPLAFLIVDQVGLLTGLAVLTLVLELGAPLAMLHPWLGRVWAVIAFGMHWGIFFIMGIRFRYQLSGVAFASFFEWDKLPRLLRLRRPDRSRLSREFVRA